EGFTITTETYGYAMSAGALIFTMGDRRIIHDGASIMFHGAGFDGYGGRQSLRSLILYGRTVLPPDRVKSLELIDAKFESILYERTLMTKEDIKDWMYKLDANFMSAKKAMQLGVATELK
ncbi:MAG: hypothetical protein ACERKJ_12205, partial [Candidatus Dadabacteria bacterium]